MDWIEGIGRAVDYIEANITEDLSIADIAAQAYASPYYFQKGFAMLCGFTVGEYIRQRRLALAGGEIVSSDQRIIDIAQKYGYDSPDSFTKAFLRFHGVAPSAARRNRATIRSFSSLKIKFTLEGGYFMDYRIVEKEAFTVIGASKMFRYDTAKAEIPAFWTEHYQTGKDKTVCGMYGVCVDENPGSDAFEYLIADNYDPSREVPAGFVTRTIPRFTWAVFPCKGPMPDALQAVNQKIFSEWLPNCKDYEIAADFNVEMYAPARDYLNGTADENYYSEIWIPVKKK